jgi:hypothetical protein
MRHFRSEELVPLPLAVAGLPSRMKAVGPGLEPVGDAGAAERLASPDRPAVLAEPLATIAPAAEAKLDPTALAEREPVRRCCHEPPGRRFLDLERGLW